MSTPCQAAKLRLLLDEKLSPEEYREVEAHVEQCPVCRAELDKLTRSAGRILGPGLRIMPGPALEEAEPPVWEAKTSIRNPPQANAAPTKYAPSRKAPEQIGRYRVERILGEGGFGLVYLAQDEQLSRRVAIKVPHAHLVAGAGAAKIYLDEARTVASLDHPNIVPVFDVGTSEQIPCYIVSKYIDGGDLREKTQTAPLSRQQCAMLVATVAEALHYAHKHGLVHRDIKPGNILIDRHGKPSVADFGLALRDKDLGKGPGYIGTPAYMSPEQARGEGHRVDGRSDIFSLGVVLYELLTGSRPFRAESREELRELISTLEVRPPRQFDDGIPKELERICLKTLSKRASERYPTARDLADDLRHFLAQSTDEEKLALHSSIPVATLAAPGACSTPLPSPMATPVLDQGAVKVVPKGLRCFDAQDADFFLDLLPGPRDREGLPESLRFWKSRIERTDPDSTFAVGLMYGPSGCGKSSFVRAGLLPRLASSVTTVYVEATADRTETHLLKSLRRQVPELPDNLGPADSLAVLRRGRLLEPGRKVLLVLDQFEQWLHARRIDEDAALVQALRQCDGGLVQVILLVRDDFWLAVSRLMQALEIRLVDGGNARLVDLFDARHALKVLTAFGRAFGALPEQERTLTKDQEVFLGQAVAGLAQDGKIIPVRLALFAEMVKGKPWTPGTVKEMGGMGGVGVTFLEETFTAPTASPAHRLRQKAAQRVLRALLPEDGTDLKGHLRSQNELLDASGYGSRPKEFADLLQMLDGELRLITPTDPEGKDEAAETHVEESLSSLIPHPLSLPYYQLTHDYLVPALREWLSRKQKETRRGRAELLLAERAAVWNARPENRQLPSFTQWLRIRWLTDKKGWIAPQQKMMRKASRYHVARSLIIVMLLTALTVSGLRLRNHVLEQQRAIRAAGLVWQLLDAEIARAPDIINEMSEYRQWTDPILKEAFADAENGRQKAQSETDRARYASRQLLASLGLLITEPNHAEYLYGRLLHAEPSEIAVIRDALQGHKEVFRERLWKVLLTAESGQEPGRLRAAVALAKYDPKDKRWSHACWPVVEEFVAQNPVMSRFWMEGLWPVRGALLKPLAQVFRNEEGDNYEGSLLATRIIAEYTADSPEELAALIEDADDRQFPILFPKLAAHRDSVLIIMKKCLLTPLASPRTNGEKDIIAKRQANAAVVSLLMGQEETVWPLLKRGSDPRLRSFLIQRLRPLGAEEKVRKRLLDEEEDVAIRQALILSLGGAAPRPAFVEMPGISTGPGHANLRDNAIPPFKGFSGLSSLDDGGEQIAPVAVGVRLDPVTVVVHRIYLEHPDPGLHGAAEWLLRHWKQTQIVRENMEQWAKDKSNRDLKLANIRRELAKPQGQTQPQWYVNGQGQTMVVVPEPGQFLMGSPPPEEGRDGGPKGIIEQQSHQRLDYSFAIGAREVTVDQFLRYQPNHYKKADNPPSLDCSVGGVTWYEAAHYCNWLSAMEGIPKNQWCYLPLAKDQYADGMKPAPDFLNRQGYRLPTEAEWEYSCRAGTSTSRYYGESQELLGEYAWYAMNAPFRLLPGGKKKPNGLGLFDMLGNATEWCHTRIYLEGDQILTENGGEIRDRHFRVLRGGSFLDPAVLIRSAQRLRFYPNTKNPNVGFRVARTIAGE